MMSHRGAVFTLVTAALWVPELRALLLESMGVTTALTRMAVAVVIAWAAVALVSSVMETYMARNAADRPQGRRPES